MLERETRNRLKPIGSIKWLDHDARAKQRRILKQFSDLIELLDSGKEIPESSKDFLRNYTSSDNVETWLNACLKTYETQEEYYHNALCEMAQHDLTAYHEFMRPDEPPAPHHIWLCDLLMKAERGELGFVGISLPPGSAKSTYGSRSFVQWFMGRHPKKRVLAVGHGQRFVEDQFSKPNRDAVDTAEFSRVFPDVMLAENNRGATTWSIEKYGGDYTCRGANAGVAGLRANLLNIDDPIKSVKDAQSTVVRDSLFSWITGDLFSRRLPRCPVIMIMTRWHSDDPMGRLERLHAEDPTALPGPAQFVNIPAQADDNDPLGRKKGEWLWEEFYGARHYETQRATMSPGLWSALYMGVPLDKMGEFVAESDFQRYEKGPTFKDGLGVKVRKTVISVDTAQKGNERSAYTAIQVFREGNDGKHYLVFAHRMQHKLDDVVKYLSRAAQIWRANYILIENAGMGTQILENNADSFACPIIPSNPQKQGSKEFRFDAAVPWIIGGRVLFPKQAPWLADLINEMVAFPDGKYKDQCDAFSQYCNHIAKKPGGGVKRLRMGA